MPASQPAQSNKIKMRKTPLDSPAKNRGRDVAERQCLANCVPRTMHTPLAFAFKSDATSRRKKRKETAGAEWKPIEIEAGVDISALWGMLKKIESTGCNNREGGQQN